MKLLIKNGHVVDPASGKDGIYDVLIEDDRIIRIDENIEEIYDDLIDATGMYVTHGLVEDHCQSKDPWYVYKENN